MERIVVDAREVSEIAVQYRRPIWWTRQVTQCRSYEMTRNTVHQRPDPHRISLPPAQQRVLEGLSNAVDAPHGGDPP